MTNLRDRDYVIPMLPCNNIDKTLEFYMALGFKVTYKQKAPNVYAAVKLGDIEIHFFVIKALVPANNFSTCYVIVRDINPLYESFKKGLAELHGKLPIKGIPRLNPLKDIPVYGVRQFVVVDPNGNYIRIGQPIPQEDSLLFSENNKNKDSVAKGSRLQKAYEAGTRYAYGKGDFQLAANAIDKALKVEKEPVADQLYQLLVLRAEIAVRMDDFEKADELFSTIEQLRSSVSNEFYLAQSKQIEELKGLMP